MLTSTSFYNTCYYNCGLKPGHYDAGPALKSVRPNPLSAKHDYCTFNSIDHGHVQPTTTAYVDTVLI